MNKNKDTKWKKIWIQELENYHRIHSTKSNNEIMDFLKKSEKNVHTVQRVKSEPSFLCSIYKKVFRIHPE